MEGEEVAVGAKYFQADGEELLWDESNDNETNLPSWRGDPEYTHSDWTIVVNEEWTYYVHKFILAAGPRSCKYFTTLFRTAIRVSEFQDSTSRITLPADQAEAFPVMLDFVYSSTGTDLGVDTNNAVTLRSFARYFGCGALMKSVNRFIQQDLTVGTSVMYLKKAAGCNDEKLEESARKLILENYDEILTASLATLPYELFRSIICSPGLEKDHHDLASGDILKYFQVNPEALNARSLNELTNHLSEVRDDCAEDLMTMVKQFAPNEEDETSLVALDKLCKLCADSLAWEWKDVDTQQSMQDFYNPCAEGDYRGSGRVEISRLSVALKQAQEDYIEMVEYRQELANRSNEERRRLLAQNENQKREIDLQKKRIVELEARNAELELHVLRPSPTNPYARQPPKRARPT